MSSRTRNVVTKKKTSKSKASSPKKGQDYYERTIVRPAARLIALINDGERAPKSASG